ncbi:MAG: hypothetical protein QOF48_482, partial [Verrucomicrobiota bacterium]
LLATATGFTETYRRFYFRDIQSITVRKTWTGAVLNAGLGFIVFVLLIGVAASSATGDVIGWSIPLGFFLVLLVANVARGSTFVCEIHTAVQSRRLGTSHRWRGIRKLLAHLRPVIETAQGPLTAEHLRQLSNAALPPASLPIAAPPVISAPPHSIL